MNILIIADIEGAVGLRTEDEVDDGRAVIAIIRDLSHVIKGCRKNEQVKNIFIWDFHGNEDNIKHDFGENIKILSHPALKNLLTLRINKVFLVGFHAMVGAKQDFCPHTYSMQDIKKFLINGKDAGEATLYVHLFSEFNIPVTFISGSHYAAQELKEKGMSAMTVSVRKDDVVYETNKMLAELETKAFNATIIDDKSNIVRTKHFRVEIDLNTPIAHLFNKKTFTARGDKKVVAESDKFSQIYVDFVNALFESWGDEVRF